MATSLVAHQCSHMVNLLVAAINMSIMCDIIHHCLITQSTTNSMLNTTRPPHPCLLVSNIRDTVCCQGARVSVNSTNCWVPCHTSLWYHPAAQCLLLTGKLLWCNMTSERKWNDYNNKWKWKMKISRILSTFENRQRASLVWQTDTPYKQIQPLSRIKTLNG